jgi:hypothetical protein
MRERERKRLGVEALSAREEQNLAVYSPAKFRSDCGLFKPTSEVGGGNVQRSCEIIRCRPLHLYPARTFETATARPEKQLWS